jgi:hypothetical protein
LWLGFKSNQLPDRTRQGLNSNNVSSYTMHHVLVSLTFHVFNA